MQDPRRKVSARQEHARPRGWGGAGCRPGRASGGERFPGPEPRGEVGQRVGRSRGFLARAWTQLTWRFISFLAICEARERIRRCHFRVDDLTWGVLAQPGSATGLGFATGEKSAAGTTKSLVFGNPLLFFDPLAANRSRVSRCPAVRQQIQ